MNFGMFGGEQTKVKFLGWIFAPEDKVRITGPKDVVRRFGEETGKIRQYYA